jgi:AcrR family transcriptional regulator
MVLTKQKRQIRERQHTEVRGKQIIDAVKKVIGKYGSENITVEKISKEVGISQAAIDRYLKAPIRERQHTEVRRKQIINAAQNIICKYGSENITIEKIAKEVGISQPAIYRHFKSKREILFLLIDSLEKSLIAELANETPNDASPLNILEHILKNHIKAVRKRHGVFFLLVAEIVSLGDKKLNKRIFETLNKYTYSIKNLIDEGIRTGDIRANIDTERTAMLLFGAVHGLVNMWTLKNRRFDIELEFSRLWASFKESISKAPGQAEVPETVLTRVAG